MSDELAYTLAPTPIEGGAAGFTLPAYGTQVAPTIGAAIATLAAPGAGNYKLTVIPSYGSTADVIDNMELKVGATVISTLKVQAAANGAPITHVFDRVAVAAGDAITVNAVAAGAVSSVYSVLILATPVG